MAADRLRTREFSSRDVGQQVELSRSSFPRELGCSRLLVRTNEANGALLSACEALGFTRLYVVEGMYHDL